MECRHLDGDRTNNNLDNLKWGTCGENTQDTIKHGSHNFLGKCGEDHYQSKISNQDRRLIVYQYATGLFSLRELAELYKVAIHTIQRLVYGKSWPFVNASILSGRSRRV